MKVISAVREMIEEQGWLPYVTLLLCILGFIGCVSLYVILSVSDSTTISDRQGTYIVEDDGEILVYANDEYYRYWVDPASGHVNLKERKSSVTTNMTEEEFFRSLEERGFSLYRDSEDKGLRKEGD